MIESPQHKAPEEFLRFVGNGIFASGVHFLILWICYMVLSLGSAGLSNFIASLVGISISFLGNKYFVFKKHADSFVLQSSKFILLYALIALLHGFVSFIVTDIYNVDYRMSFLIALFLQLVLGYIGNKLFVFTR